MVKYDNYIYEDGRTLDMRIKYVKVNLPYTCCYCGWE